MTKRKSTVKSTEPTPTPKVPAPNIPGGDIIFARTRHHYDPYQDYYKLVELSGFPTVYVDEITARGWSDKTIIVTPINGEWKHGIKTDARVILYQLEWIHDGEDFEAPPGVDAVWSGDAWHARRIGAKYVPMGSHPGLAADFPTVRQMEYDYDIAFLAYLTHRRQTIRDRLTNFKVSPSSAWGQARHDILESSRLYLHIHQHDNVPTIAPLRMVVAAAYGLPVLSEEVVDQGIFAGRMVTEPYERLVERMGYWLSYPGLREYGEALKQQLTVDWTFKRSVEANV